MSDDEKHTEASLIEALRRKYGGSDYAFVAHVPNATGSAKSRTADGLAMSLWPSKGLLLNGFECKISRSDWLSELQDPTKACAFERYCHYWWIVAPASVVKIEEMPANWGWMSPSEGGLRVKKGATLNNSPEPIGYELIAGIFRACARQSPAEKEILAAYHRGRDDAYKEEKQRSKPPQSDSEARANKMLLDTLKRDIEKFEKASGLQIDGYSGERLGEAVAIVQSIGLHRIAQNASEIKRTCGHIIANCDHAIKLHEAMKGKA